MDEQILKQEIQTIDDRVDEITVTDQVTYESAGAVVLELEGLVKKITAYWDEPIKKAHEAHKALTAKRAEMLKPVEDRKKLIRGKITAYLTEQECIRREEQRKLDDERRSQEAAERAKLEAKAAKAEASGKLEKAEELREKAAEVFAAPAIVQPIVEQTTRTDAGTISQKKDIRVTITDPMEILKAVVAGRLPIGIVTISEPKLKQAIKLGGINNLPGCIIEQVVNAQFRGIA